MTDDTSSLVLLCWTVSCLSLAAVKGCAIVYDPASLKADADRTVTIIKANAENSRGPWKSATEVVDGK